MYKFRLFDAKQTKFAFNINLFLKQIYPKIKNRHFLYFLLIACCCGVVFGFNVWLKYEEFKSFRFTPFFEGKITKSFSKTNKHGKEYYVLHLDVKNFTLYTTLKTLPKTNHLRFKIVKNKITFKDFLKARFYAPIYQVSELENYDYNGVWEYILSQHQNQKMKDFYGALFFAKPISNELRNDINHYAIAHLLAISGYHLGLIYGILFFSFKFIYRYFQQRFFPYRCIEFDLGVLIFTIIGIYFVSIGFVPSFLRSFVMAILGFYLVCKGIKIVNFMHLFLAFLICVSLFPSLVFNVGFFFSCMGVFYIFLYARHFFKKSFLSAIGFEIWTFFAMVLPVLYFFPLFSMQQLLGIVITPIFVVFYPLSAILHIFGGGGLFDSLLLAFLDFKLLSKDVFIPQWIFLTYIVLSFVSIFNKYLAIILVGSNIFIFIWFFIKNYLLLS